MRGRETLAGPSYGMSKTLQAHELLELRRFMQQKKMRINGDGRRGEANIRLKSKFTWNMRHDTDLCGWQRIKVNIEWSQELHFSQHTMVK